MRFRRRDRDWRRAAEGQGEGAGRKRGEERGGREGGSGEPRGAAGVLFALLW